MKTIVTVAIRHDNGTQKINVWAASLEDAKAIVCKNENCPPAAIVSAKVKPLSISDIKHRTQETAPYFFDRKTMKFWGQTMRDFSVTRYGDDKFYIRAKHTHGTTERIFNPFTNELEHC